jgi:hypothetical protein
MYNPKGIDITPSVYMHVYMQRPSKSSLMEMNAWEHVLVAIPMPFGYHGLLRLIKFAIEDRNYMGVIISFRESITI